MAKQSSTDHFNLLVVGCGPAGQRAAIQSSKVGKSVCIVDKHEFVGGNCINTGTIPSKSFKEAVLHLSGYRHRSIYGQSYRVKDEIQMPDLTLRCHHIMQAEIETVRAQLRRNNIEVVSGTAHFEDAHTVTVESVQEKKRRISADHIVIAVGARPHHPDSIPFDGQNIFDSDDILTLQELPRRLTIVGGGVIGTEYASMFAALGTLVTIIDTRTRLLGFLDREISETLQYHLRSQGVTLRLGEEVASCAVREDSQVVTTLASGKVVISDSVLVSAGRRSATESIGLENAGVEIAERGLIIVNENYQTNVPHIYAAGDVIGFPALAATSREQGRLAAVHAYGIEDELMDVPLPFGIYAIPEISYVGYNEQELTRKNIPYEVGISRFKEIARGQMIGDANGLLKVLFHRETEEVLGVHIIGEYATELVHIGQAVIALNGKLQYLRDAVFNYPTLAECYKVAALDGYNKLRA